MGKYSYGKLYGFGQLAKQVGKELSGEEWAAWIRREKFDAVEIQIIIDGYRGDEFRMHHRHVVIPFAPFKGQTLEKLTTKYLNYLLTKEWLDKYIDLRMNIEHVLKEREKEKNIAQDILKETLRQLK